MNELQTVLEYMPIGVKNEIKSIIKSKENQIEEIRLRSNKPLAIKIEKNTIITSYIVNQQEVLQAFDKICENSIYTYRNQICEGYITIKGGHRVGMVGSGVIENGQVRNVNYISSLNFRIARQKIGCSNQIIYDIVDLEKNTVYNTLIISPPRGWKDNIVKRHYKKYK